MSGLTPTIQIRDMALEDLDAIDHIESKTYPFPWSGRIFGDCLRIGYRCRVMTCGDELIAYSVFSQGAGEGHILNLTVSDLYRKQGVGRRLLRDTVNHAREQGLERVFLEVRPSNYAARCLYDSEGFEPIGLRKDYYRSHNGREDAMVYACALAADRAAAARD